MIQSRVVSQLRFEMLAADKSGHLQPKEVSSPLRNALSHSSPFQAIPDHSILRGHSSPFFVREESRKCVPSQLRSKHAKEWPDGLSIGNRLNRRSVCFINGSALQDAE